MKNWKHKIEYLDINTFIPYIKNARVHDKEQIEQVVNSIKEFGFTNPVIIDENNTIIAGHCRVLASKKLKLKTIPTIKLHDLTENQKKAYIIADNKIAENSSWDDNLLRCELTDLRAEIIIK